MSKSKSTKKFPYDDLHEFVKKERKERKRWIIYSLFLTIILFIYLLLLAISSLDLIGSTGFAVILCVIVFILLMIVLLVQEGFNRLSDNYKYINRVLAEFYLKPLVFTLAEIDNIDRRAEIGKNAGPMRTLLPLLLIPLLVSLTVNVIVSFGTTVMSLVLILLAFILALALIFLLELDRANTDVVILHAIAEYRKQRKYAEVVERKAEADEMTLRAIVEAKQKHSHIQANEQRTSAEVSRLIRVHGTPVHQRPSQQSVASTNGVGADDEVACQPSNDR